MNTPPNLIPPVARKEPKQTTLHGHTLQDDYAWMREKSSPEVTAYLEAENAYTDAFMAPTKPLQGQLYQEMLSHIKETDISVPYRKGQYFYYTRTVEGLQYPIHCRRAASPENRYDESLLEQVILDVNQLAQGQNFMAVGDTDITDDGTLLAYSTDNTGFRQYTMHVRDLRTGEDLPDTAKQTGSLVWAADNTTLFYTVEDDATKRHYRLYRHTLGSPQSADVLVYEEPDERFNLGAGRTRDGKYILLEIGSHITTEYRFLAADNPTGEFQRIAPRIDDQQYYVDHCNGTFFIRTNDAGRNFRLVTTPIATPDRAHWKEVLPHRTDVSLEDFDLFGSFLGIYERANGLPKLRVLRFDGDQLGTTSQEITFPEPTYSAAPSVNREFDTTVWRYSYQSLVTPGSIYDYDVNIGTSTLLKQQEVPGGFDRTLYGSERLFATASDGTQIPISLVYRKDKFAHDGKSSLYVYGYGSYGYPLPVSFNPSRLSLLDRGLVLAYAHIRGGGDLGDPWHDAGKMMTKQNTFTDFIAVTEHLLKNGYGATDKVAIEGGSAGGLLMGAVVNLRPDLFSVVLSHVPFVDVMNTMLDATLPLTVPEYEEWGNPNERGAFEYMLGYSPYDNLKPGAYPAMLVKTSLHDSQVMYWEPAKYIAKLRTFKTDTNPLLLHTNMTAGHGGASGRYDYLKEIAFDYAFLLTQFGVE
ncbi:MAG: S9 family peptidase [Acidobacteriaceae bacterium]